MSLAGFQPAWLLLSSLIALGIPLWLADTTASGSRLRRVALGILFLGLTLILGLVISEFPEWTERITFGIFAALAAFAALAHALTRLPRRASLTFLLVIAGTSGVLLCRGLELLALLNLTAMGIGVGIGFLPLRACPSATVQDAAAAGSEHEPALTSVMTCLLACALGTGIVRAVGIEPANAAARAQPARQSAILPGDFRSHNTVADTAWAERDPTATLLILAGLLAVSLIAAATRTGHESAASGVQAQQIHTQQIQAQQDGGGRS